MKLIPLVKFKVWDTLFVLLKFVLQLLCVVLVRFSFDIMHYASNLDIFGIYFHKNILLCIKN